MIKSKKGVSPLIATILLILISIIAIASIFAFVVPFVKDMLEESKECFNIPEQISIIDSSVYTCFNNDKSKIGVSVKRSSEEVEIGGFKISVKGKDASNTDTAVIVEIKQGEFPTDAYMLDGSQPPVLPGRGEEKTYVITLNDVTPEKVVIAPISAKGELCNVADEVEIPLCSQSVKDGATFLARENG